MSAEGRRVSGLKAFVPRRVLVTGGAGFIGANFVHHLLAADPTVEVVTLDKLTYAGSLANLAGADPRRHRFVRGDICDADRVEGLLREHAIDTLVNFAAESHVDRSISGPAPFIHTNLVGTFTLLEAARRVWLAGTVDPSACRFHQVSTDEVYGSLDADEAPWPEHARYDPSSPYSASKAGADHLVRAYHRTYGLPVTLSNCANNYGPRQHAEKLIPTVIRCCLADQAVPIYGDGRQVRDWLYVDDHCRALEAVIRGGAVGETYNIGASAEATNLVTVQQVCAVLDRLQPGPRPYAGLLRFVADRPGHDRRYALDCQRLRDGLGWRPHETFDSGLEKTVHWYLQHAAEV